MKFLLTIISILSVQLLFAQAPQAIGFQGVAYGPDSEPLKEQNIKVKTEVLENSATGTSVYSENHDITTNTNGLYDLKIGRGNVENGNFADLNWAGSSMYLRVSLSMDGVEYYEAGTTEFLSVPYALVAGSAEPSPKIFVTQNPHVDFQDIKFFNSRRSADFRYIYHWVQGNPEDVLVEIEGLPDGICLETTSVSAYGLGNVIKEPIFNTSNVDTIRHGIVKPRTDLVKCDPDATITPGTYQLLYKFKIGERVLETLPVTMLVDPILYADCLSEFPLTLSVSSNTCDPSIIMVEDQITIAEGTPEAAVMTNPFTGVDVELETDWYYCSFRNRDFVLPGDELPGSEVDFDFRDEIATFEIRYQNEEYEYEYCEIIYKK